MFLKGFKAMLPITTGILPFGLVMGTVSYAANLSSVEALGMNFIMFSGSAQLAVIELMLQDTSSIVVIATGLLINLRFMLYSAAFSPYVENSNLWVKIFCAYNLTDQTYSAMKANEDKYKSIPEAVEFYIGSAICMLLAWHGSVIIGFIFGNFLPTSIALDYAIPLSFITLVIPTLKHKNYIYVAILSTVLSIIFKPLPYNLGLLSSALLALMFGAFLNRKSLTESQIKNFMDTDNVRDQNSPELNKEEL